MRRDDVMPITVGDWQRLFCWRNPNCWPNETKRFVSGHEFTRAAQIL